MNLLNFEPKLTQKDKDTSLTSLELVSSLRTQRTILYLSSFIFSIRK
jgi:hypothetical protein